MNNKKCPYCGRRVRYASVFSTKKKGSYICERCKKESKVKISNAMLPLFAALCLLIALFMILWINAGNANNFAGVIIVALVVIIFYFLTPLFVNFVPLKKYKNEIRNTKSYEEKVNIDSMGDSDFIFNREAFDKIKRQKEIGINSLNFDVDNNVAPRRENMVPVIEDIKEGHISSSDAPLHKINRQPKQYAHKYEKVFDEIQSEEEVKQYVPKKKKPEGSRYTANRRL